MELETMKKELQQIEKNLSFKVKNIECYLFGSILNNPKLANDIDILIIYEDVKHLKVLKEEFGALEMFYPLHISYFTFFEQNQFNFIREQKAEKVFIL
jgi:predicted nucleotidyltransferase